jgi:hypothetical protein
MPENISGKERFGKLEKKSEFPRRPPDISRGKGQGGPEMKKSRPLFGRAAPAAAVIAMRGCEPGDDYSV